MKTFFAIVLIMTGVTGFSQHKHDRMGMKDMTPEQVANLETKKMTLALDLTEKQQGQIQQINLEKAIDRKARMEERKERGDAKPDADERYALMNERLDKQIAMKEQMKDILDKDQYDKWEKLSFAKARKGHCKVSAR